MIGLYELMKSITTEIAVQFKLNHSLNHSGLFSGLNQTEINNSNNSKYEVRLSSKAAFKTDHLDSSGK